MGQIFSKPRATWAPIYRALTQISGGRPQTEGECLQELWQICKLVIETNFPKGIHLIDLETQYSDGPFPCEVMLGKLKDVVVEVYPYKLIVKPLDVHYRLFTIQSLGWEVYGVTPEELEANYGAPGRGYVTPCLTVVRGIFDALRARFTAGVDAGQLRVMARVGSLSADFTEVPLDIWKHYTVDDWTTGHACSNHDGSRLFSIHVAIAADEPGVRASSAGTGSAVRDWLIRQMLTPSTIRRKEDCREEAEERFKISVRAFNRAWKDAVKTTRSGWDKPGPRPGSAKSKQNAKSG
jgi:hypothetical protein